MAYTGATIVGMDELMKKIEAKFSDQRVSRVVNKALKEIGAEQAKDLQSVAQAFVDPELIVSSRVSRSGGIPSVKIGWSGGRWQVVHLNEFGFNHLKAGEFVKQRGFGVMRAFVYTTEATYMDKLKDKLEELIK
ncbi:hypothetical protein [Pseudolactococcus reticulitermitis]|uniref:HK97 gp10 family phage protein n=1 Tax=Pseudolactococcus reticulitermitis TaxID=2025039 RepID=A0A224XBK9_9LACT|nr:hypothetical protein [Lactococcus reticulitermitis]GAX47312.1 hypothetical protein RsY01_911 [Lactococcus reticulitermitis]